MRTVKWFWAAVAIVSMWVAVLFAGVFGGEIVNDDVTTHTRIPVAVAVALCAVLATVAVARHGFRGDDGDTASLRTEIEAERECRRRLEGELERLAHEVAELREGDLGGADRQAVLTGTQGR
jgi:hypothetical protein